ncbi:MAG: hypothetical protein AAGF83_12830 [Cyanobacteria bacterium P01_G01_bin.67]
MTLKLDNVEIWRSQQKNLANLNKIELIHSANNTSSEGNLTN